MIGPIGSEYALLLLAGGKSSRMGTDKGALMYQGRSFLDTLLQKAAHIGITHFYLSQHTCTQEDVVIVEDRYKNCGPIGGIHACMKAMDLPYCLVLPVDVPQIPVHTLKGLLTEHKRLRGDSGAPPALLLKHGDREEPLIGIYSTSLAGIMEAYMDQGRFSLFTTLNDTGYRVWEQDIPEWQIDNINTPESYRQLIANTEKNR